MKKLVCCLLACLLALGPAGFASAKDTQIGTLVMDTRSYMMAPGNIYDFKAVLNGDGLDQSSLKVWDSRGGSVVRFYPIPSKPGVYRITAVAEGVTYIVAEYRDIHASIRVEVKKGVSQHGEACRSISIISERAKEEEKGLPAGTYEIGKDIPEGEYVLIPEGTNSGYYIRSKQTEEKTEKLASGSVYNRGIVAVKKGETLEVRLARIYEAEQAPQQELVQGYYPQGVYKVGRDIPNGIYLAKSTQTEVKGTYRVYSSNAFDLPSQTSGGVLSDETAIILRTGQYLILQWAKLVPTSGIK